MGGDKVFREEGGLQRGGHHTKPCGPWGGFWLLLGPRWESWGGGALSWEEAGSDLGSKGIPLVVRRERTAGVRAPGDARTGGRAGGKTQADSGYVSKVEHGCGEQSDAGAGEDKGLRRPRGSGGT